jgi:hypothetical protein
MSAAAARWSPSVSKEVRALLPTYGAAMIAVVLGSVGETYFLIASGLLGFALGSVTLGAQSFGHEYSHRTLGLLLSQPRDRRRLFLDKLLVLSAMLATLTSAALLLFDETLRRASSPHTEPAMLVLAAACGLFVAPWLTMLCRSTLAGVIFTIGIPGLLATGADIVGGLVYGLHDAAAIDRFRLVVFWRGMMLICALSAIAGWRLFLRLEAVEGHGGHVQLPESLGLASDVTAAATVRRRHPVLALVAKEIRLQQMAFVVAALFALAWVGLAWLERSSTESQSVPLLPLTMLYVGSLALLIGSLASAEERHLGTVEWQMLVPMPGWQQWLVKVGVVLAMVVLLCGVLPAILASLTPGDQSLDRGDRWQIAPTLALLTVGSLYLSSLCKTGVGALVLSLPAVVATVFYVRTVLSLLWDLSAAAPRFSMRPHDSGLLLVAIVAGFGALLLWLGFRNHRTADRSRGRIVQQALAIAGYITVGLTLLVLGVR